MRYLVYLLLLLNLGLFGWTQVRPQPPAPAMRQAGPPVPAGVQRLVLLSERGAPAAEAGPKVEQTAALAGGKARQPSAGSSGGQGAASVGAAAAPAPVCETVGPLDDAALAESLRDELAGPDLSPTLRTGEIQVPSGYQVYLQADSPGHARKVVQDLEAAGMKDYFVGRGQRISLGIFNYRSKALARQRTVRALGHDARLDARYKVRKVWWVDVVGRAAREELDTRLAVALEAHPELKVQRVSCE